MTTKKKKEVGNCLWMQLLSTIILEATFPLPSETIFSIVRTKKALTIQRFYFYCTFVSIIILSLS